MRRPIRTRLRLRAAVVAVAALAVAMVMGQQPASAASSILTAGQELTSGQFLQTGNFQLTMQSDGNLVMRACGSEVWATSTWGHPGAFLIMQTDGNLVIYTPSGQAVWNTGTNGHGGAFVAMQGDSNLVVYGGGRALWNSSTVGAGDCSDRLFGTVLGVGQTITTSTPLWSADRGHEFFLAGCCGPAPGLFLLSKSANRYTFADTTCGVPSYGYVSGGDFVIVGSSGLVGCTTRTSSPGNTYLQMQNDGNLVLYTDFHSAMWSTGTAGQ